MAIIVIDEEEEEIETPSPHSSNPSVKLTPFSHLFYVKSS